MLIKLTNADFSAAGLGKVTRYIGGVPSTNLRALYLMNDGVDGDDVTTLTDFSGNGNHATLLDGWDPAVQRSYGIEVDQENGVAYEVPLPCNLPGQEMTVFVSARNKLPSAESNVFNTFFGSKDNGNMLDPSLAHTNAPSLCLNFSGQSAAGNFQIFDSGSDLLGAGTVGFTGEGPGYGEAGAVGFGLSAVSDEVILHVEGATDRVQAGAATALTDFYDGVTDRGNMLIGCWPQNIRSTLVTSIADIYAIAIYDRVFTEAAAASYLSDMKTIAQVRGVTFP
ncbi:hypothetical protein LA6_003445 [Marinibacterium anthonyi]|nr:hypothetical protein LA6_003445 [Marinibacterium anthonyi]